MTQTERILERIRTHNRNTNQSPHYIKEDINRFIWDFRNYYQSGRVYTFKQWLKILEDMLDEIV